VTPILSTRAIAYVERENWTAGTTLRRYTRLSNRFSRKLRNCAPATALNHFAYNFIKIHLTLRMSPQWRRWRYRSAVECRRPGCPLGILRAAEGGKSGVIDAIIKYGKYAPLLTGILLVHSAVTRPKPGAKWYGPYVIGAMGVVLLYVSVHMLLKSK